MTTDNKLDIKTGKLLKELGISPALLGYRYSIEAVKRTVENAGRISGIFKMYEEISRQFKCTTASVERSIRHAIEKGILRGNWDKWMELFSFSYANDRPTNKEFIATLAEYLITSEE